MRALLWNRARAEWMLRAMLATWPRRRSIQPVPVWPAASASADPGADRQTESSRADREAAAAKYGARRAAPAAVRSADFAQVLRPFDGARQRKEGRLFHGRRNHPDGRRG